MANNERMVGHGLKKGPCVKTIRKALNQALNGHRHPIIPLFGNGYREFPIEITGVEVVCGSNKSLIINITGRMNYRDCHPRMPKSNVSVRNYSPYFRTGEGISSEV